MSPLEAIRAVFASGLPATDRSVLVAWCSHLDSNTRTGRAGPSLLSDETGLSMSACKRKMAGFRKAGILVGVGVWDGRYQIDRFEPTMLPTRASVTRAAPTRVAADPVCRSTGTRAGEARVPVPEKHGMEDKMEDKMEDNIIPASQPSVDDESSPLLRRHAALSQPDPEPSDAKQWGHLADAYGALPGCIRPKARKKGNGIALDKLLDHHGLDLAKLVVRWWAYGDGKAEYLRDNRHKLATLARDVHLDKYAEDAEDWKARGSPGDPSAALVARAPRVSIDEQVARDVARAKQQIPRYKRQRRT